MRILFTIGRTRFAGVVQQDLYHIGAGGPCRAAGTRCTSPSTSPPGDGARRPPRRTRAHKRASMAPNGARSMCTLSASKAPNVAGSECATRPARRAGSPRGPDLFFSLCVCGWVGDQMYSGGRRRRRVTSSGGGVDVLLYARSPVMHAFL